MMARNTPEVWRCIIARSICQRRPALPIPLRSSHRPTIGGKLAFSTTAIRSSEFKGAEADPDVSSATQFADLPDALQGTDLPDTGGVEGKAVRDEVARVMEQPEINGQPVALDFSSKGRTKGCARTSTRFFVYWSRICVTAFLLRNHQSQAWDLKNMRYHETLDKKGPWGHGVELKQKHNRTKSMSVSSQPQIKQGKSMNAWHISMPASRKYPINMPNVHKAKMHIHTCTRCLSDSLHVNVQLQKMNAWNQPMFHMYTWFVRPPPVHIDVLQTGFIVWIHDIMQTFWCIPAYMVMDVYV